MLKICNINWLLPGSGRRRLFDSARKNLRYVEAFTGIERVFKWSFAPLAKFKLGVYVVGSAANQFRNPVLFKIGITTWDRILHKWK